VLLLAVFVSPIAAFAFALGWASVVVKAIVIASQLAIERLATRSKKRWDRGVTGEAHVPVHCRPGLSRRAVGSAQLAETEPPEPLVASECCIGAE
jgi:hypothetical protein